VCQSREQRAASVSNPSFFPCSPQARLGRTSTDAVEVGAGVQAGMERAREVADGERPSTQSPDAAGGDAGAHGAADASQQPSHGSGSSNSSSSGGSSGSSDGRRQGGDSPQQVPELYAPGRLLYIRRDSGAGG
jgi:hypothetical protein